MNHFLSDLKFKFETEEIEALRPKLERLEALVQLLEGHPIKTVIKEAKETEIDPELIEMLESPNRQETLELLGRAMIVISPIYRYLMELLLNYIDLDLIIKNAKLKQIYNIVAIILDDVSLFKQTKVVYSDYRQLSSRDRLIISYDAIKIYSTIFESMNLVDPEIYFYYACCAGSLRLVRYLRDSIVDINLEILGANPLIGACISNDIYVVKYLVSEGADINSRVAISNSWVITPLIAAGNRNAYTIIEYLISLGADINLADDHDCTVFSNATRVLSYDLDECPEERELHLRNIQLVDFLLEHNPDINTGWSKGSNPLYNAVKGRRKNYVEKFLDLGADIERTGSYGTPLMMACLNDDEVLVEYLISRGANVQVVSDQSENLLHLAVRNRNLKLVELFVGLGVEIDLEDDLYIHNYHERLTPLGLAILDSNFKIAKYLLDSGADPNYRFKGEPPLNITGQPDERKWAREGITSFFKPCDNTKLVRYLIRKGAKINGVEGQTPPIFNLTKRRNTKKLKLIIRRGADVNIRNKDGRTPLMEACSNYSFKAVKILVTAGAEIDVQDRFGTTALMVATKNCREDMIRFLLRHGADITLKNNRGRHIFNLTDNWCVKRILKEIFGEDILVRPRSTETGRITIGNRMT